MKNDERSEAAIPEQCDVIIIGAGFGGLTAGALLAKAGMSVCVTEMASVPGGCVSGFDRDGFHFETAIHWLNQCGPGGFVRRILDFVGTNTPQTPPNTKIRRLLGENHDFLLTNNPDEMRDAMIAYAPEEESPIRRFFYAADGTARAFASMQGMCRIPQTMGLIERTVFLPKVIAAGVPLLRYLRFSAEDGLRQLFPSSCLERVFCSEERLLSCLVPIGWARINDYQIPPKGGSQKLVQHLCAGVSANNGTIAYGCKVRRVLVKGNRAIGVRVEHTGVEKEIRARHVIASCDVATLYRDLLPPGTVNSSLVAKQQKADLYTSCVTVSLGLDCRAEEMGLGTEQVLLTRGDVSRGNYSSSDPHKTEISVIGTSVRDSSLAPPGKGTLNVYAPCSISYGDFWRCSLDATDAPVRGKAYRSLKEEYADILLARVEQKLCPGLSRHIEVRDVATPITYLRYTGNQNGAIMGFRPTGRNIRNRVCHYITPVKNLLIGGQWAELGGGVPGAVKAGLNSALLILRREAPEAFKTLCGVVDGKGARLN